MTPLALAGLILGGLAAAAGATTAGLVLTTSGPFAGTSTNAAASPTATPTPTPATPTATRATPSPTAPIKLDADGWPVVTCPAGLQPNNSATRKITGCGPADFRFLNDEQDGTNGRPPEVNLLLLEWRNLSARWEYMSIQIVSKASHGNWRGTCNKTSQVTLLGFPADQCLILREDLNGSALDQSDTWGIQQFAETPAYWIVADAAGPQSGSDRQPAIQRALEVFASVAANGLVRVK